MDKIILLPNREKDPQLTLSLQVLSVLKTFCTRVYTEKQNDRLISEGATAFSYDEFPKDAQLLLVLGGDGTVLHAASIAIKYDIPILGINMGRLGYLATIDPCEIEELKKLANDTYFEQTRMTLDVELHRQNGEKVFLGTALNDICVDGYGHLADLRLCEKKSYIDYRADGLIIATPTGSTAYSLSAGGPVLDENMQAICVTPVCPRSFFSRSILFSHDSYLYISNESVRPSSLRVCIDGCTEVPISYRDTVHIYRSKRDVRLLILKPRRLLEVLSTKMNTTNF